MPIPAIIALGVMAAAAIAGSQMSASDTERRGKRQARRMKDEQEKDAQLEYWQRRSDKAAAESGLETWNDAGTAWRNHDKREAGYNNMLTESRLAADEQRTQGYLQAGSTVASGIASGAFDGRGGAESRWLAGGNFDAQNAATSGLTADQIGNAAGKYALNESVSPLLAKLGEYDSNAGPMFDYTQPLQQDLWLLNDPNGYRFRGRL